MTALALECEAASEHSIKVGKIERAIDLVCSSMASNRKYHQSKDEDALTTHITDKLFDHGFPALHDADTSGHPDIKISYRSGFEWLCEAKVHSSYSWIFKGFKQLTTRYSCGGQDKTSGEVLIYCYNKKAQDVLDTWLGQLSKKVPSVSCGQLRSGYFYSNHTHIVSGLEYTVRHKIVGLYYAPEA